jgi:hypothetical protein
VQVFEIKDSEVITGISIGHITSAARREVLFTCYSGMIKTLIDKRQARKLGATTEDTTQMTEVQLKQEKSEKLNVLTAEI